MYKHKEATHRATILKSVSEIATNYSFNNINLHQNDFTHHIGGGLSHLIAVQQQQAKEPELPTSARLKHSCSGFNDIIAVPGANPSTVTPLGLPRATGPRLIGSGVSGQTFADCHQTSRSPLNSQISLNAIPWGLQAHTLPPEGLNKGAA